MRGWLGSVPQWVRREGLPALLITSFAAFDGTHVAALPAAPGPRGPVTPEQAAIERAPVCIGSAVASAGELADILYYRAASLGDGRFAVGYFAFFSEERPWGNNWLTWSVLPALAVDLAYSRALLVAPGVQRALYGAGDVEGVSIFYEVTPTGELRVDHALAEDRRERVIALSRREVFALDRRRPTFYSEVWSHQLGGRGARSLSDLTYVRCYEGDSIRPLPDDVARAFRLGDRAGPAHVERLGPPLSALPAERLGAIDDPRRDEND
ncbi:MAG TPA: hypothetical protein VGM06_19055 [Polyangiaceae bacterium]|jgi:hypothetical protein